MIKENGLYKCKKSINEEIKYYEDEEETVISRVERVMLTKGDYYFITLTNLNEHRLYQSLNMVGDNGKIIRMSDYDSNKGIDLKGEKYSDYIRWYFKDYFYSDVELRKVKIKSILNS